MTMVFKFLSKKSKLLLKLKSRDAHRSDSLNSLDPHLGQLAQENKWDRNGPGPGQTIEEIWVIHITSLKREQAIQLTFRRRLEPFGALL